ncbi:BTAD domain-containing putative transcriptional regulator [Streptomyces sp. TRM 70351]|uniref:AfsR/SARP family transcriptional regulator n=1 Tax=Streptomyces sp. TRM 70351 TaxID=3116552 RepID=UPI002E7AEBB8|nr:BTAD domain-containing putative transcriptional regulator [Streptomyces sp. TRM 70351]MEE1930494.1 BTAD domain-containing putative transcriptional regulator [Streptomyces sp. TRM 70351]
MRFGVLGPLAVWTGEGEPVTVPEAKVRALLADLLVHEGRTVSVDRLTQDVWGDRPPGNPANTLQTKVSQLRRALERAETGARALVAHRPPGYALVTAEVDAARFRDLAARARAAADPRAASALFAEALGLWRGPAYADFADEEFARAAAVRLDEERLTAVEEHAETRLDLGEHRQLAAELGEVVERHPLRERLRAVHLRALYRSGRQGEALAAYEDLRHRLAEELGVDPSPELAALHRDMLTQAPRLAPAPEPPRRTRGNLPAPLTALVGRDEAVARLRRLLGSARLVTLTGPGGVGKTRLAVETAAGLPAAAAPDGVWLVELGPVRPHAGGPGGTAAAPAGDASGGALAVEDAVLAALGLRDDAGERPGGRPPGGRAPGERVAEALHGKEVLLILDNCEHVVDTAAALAAGLLRAAPGVRVLATSQEPLALSGEVVWPVPPLDGAGARELFAARAAAADPGLDLDDPRTAEAVAAISRRLDGIPLALELAATRVRVLGVPELAARLDDRFRVLGGGLRGAPARQQTLRAVLEWSWELLTGAEAVVLRRLAVHADGCALAAAEAVCAGAERAAPPPSAPRPGALPGEDAAPQDAAPGDEASEGAAPGDVAPADVLDVLARLVDRSLVTVVPTPAGPRYRLLETVAAYGLERLREAGELETLRGRHAAWYAALAEEAAGRLHGPQQCAWLERLDAESGNLRAALDTAHRQGAAETALRLAGALGWFWFVRGRTREARRALELALATPGPAPHAVRATAQAWHAATALLDSAPEERQALAEAALGDRADSVAGPVRAHAAWLVALALWTTGELSASESWTLRALRELPGGDRWTEAAALVLRGKQALVRGDLAAARSDGLASATAFAELGDGWGRLQAAELLAGLAEITGDYVRARELCAQALRTAEELGLGPQAADWMTALARVALLTGDAEQARELHERALRRSADQGYTAGVIHAETGLALGARRSGDLDAAEAQLLRTLERHRRIDFDPGSALLLAELGFVAELRGEAQAALARHSEGLAVARRVGDPRAVALALEGLAGARVLAGEAREAARLLGAAEAARTFAGAPLPPGERGDVARITAAARAALGGDAFAAAHAAGAALPWDTTWPEQDVALTTSPSRESA